MPQLSKGETFADGQQVTGVRLNNLVDGATILPGLITDQTNLTANTVASGDSVLLYDLSATALREATASDLLNSGLSITTGSITGNAAADLVLTPAAGQKVDVAGNIEADDVHVTDDLTVADDATISGDLLVTGGSTLTGNVIADNGFTSNGTANFTGSFQFNGVTAYSLSEIVEENIPGFTATNNAQLYDAFTSASYTKPSGEIWVFEFNTTWVGNSGRIHYRLTNSADTVVYQMKNAFINTNSDPQNFIDTFTFDSSTTFTGTFVLRTYNAQAGVILNPTSAEWSARSYVAYDTVSKFRIYKYKTA